jgi:CRP-like cAMP-binding protein
MQNLLEILRGVEIFDGLDEPDLELVARVCLERRLHLGDYLATEGQPGDELYIITQGFVEVLLGESKSSGRVVVNLGVGQIIGEMSLLDQGPRSASLRAVEEPTVVQAIHRKDLNAIFLNNYRIGFIVMRNLAADLSFKLRHRNLSSTAL